MYEQDLAAYYAARSPEYEKVYDKPERQRDLARIAHLIQDVFWGKSVLELACGTGWWTQQMAITAQSVVATDINDAMLDIARRKAYPAANVTFQRDDVFKTRLSGSFDGVFAGFFWSHVPSQRLDEFLQQTFARVRPGGVAVFLDNRMVPGSSTPIHHTDNHGNTYQLRRLQDGTTHLVLKNFPDPSFLSEILSNHSVQPAVCLLDHYWLAVCRTPE